MTTERLHLRFTKKPPATLTFRCFFLLLFYYYYYSCQIKFHESVFAALHGESNCLRARLHFQFMFEIWLEIFPRPPLCCTNSLDWLLFSDFAEQRFSLYYVFFRAGDCLLKSLDLSVRSRSLTAADLVRQHQTPVARLREEGLVLTGFLPHGRGVKVGKRRHWTVTPTSASDGADIHSVTSYFL